MLNAANANTLDLNAGPYFVTAWSLPDARPSDFGRAAQRAGAHKVEDHYEEPPYSVSVGVRGSAPADIDALVAEFYAGTALYWSESGLASGTTRLVSVETDTPKIREGYTVITFSGFRRPAWDTASYPFSGTVSYGFGTYTLPVVGGEIGAKMGLSMVSASAWYVMGAGVKPDPAATYLPIDVYNAGAATPVLAIDGTTTTQKATRVTLTSSDQALGAAPALAIAGNRGNHLVVVRTATDATTVDAKASSLVGSVSDDTPHASLAGAATHHVVGVSRIPSAAMPAGTGGSIWKAATGVSHATNSGLVTVPTHSMIPEYNKRETWQTFDVGATRRIKSHSRKFQCDNYASVTAELWATPNDIFTTLLKTVSGPVLMPDTLTDVLATFDYPVAAGRYGVKFIISPVGSATVQSARDTGAGYANGKGGYSTGSNYTAGDGTDTTVDWVFTTVLEEEVSFDAKTQIYAKTAVGGKYADHYHTLRIPTDHAAVCVAKTTAQTAGTGILYDADLEAVFPFDGTSVTGPEMDAAYKPRQLSVVPGVTNLLVVAGSGTVTIAGTITERRIRRG